MLQVDLVSCTESLFHSPFEFQSHLQCYRYWIVSQKVWRRIWVRKKWVKLLVGSNSNGFEALALFIWSLDFWWESRSSSEHHTSLGGGRYAAGFGASALTSLQTPSTLVKYRKVLFTSSLSFLVLASQMSVVQNLPLERTVVRGAYACNCALLIVRETVIDIEDIKTFFQIEGCRSRAPGQIEAK